MNKYNVKQLQLTLFFGFICGFGLGALVVVLNFVSALDYLIIKGFIYHD